MKYQGCVTGRPYGIGEGRTGWNEEWLWLGTDWDGFVSEECLLQEAKGNYDMFFEGPIRDFVCEAYHED